GSSPRLSPHTRPLPFGREHLIPAVVYTSATWSRFALQQVLRNRSHESVQLRPATATVALDQLRRPTTPQASSAFQEHTRKRPLSPLLVRNCSAVGRNHQETERAAIPRRLSTELRGQSAQGWAACTANSDAPRQLQ